MYFYSERSEFDDEFSIVLFCYFLISIYIHASNCVLNSLFVVMRVHVIFFIIFFFYVINLL